MAHPPPPPPQQRPQHREPDDDRTRQRLSAFLGADVRPREFHLPGGTRIAVDHADPGDPPHLVAQSSALSDRLRSAHRNKAIADAFKLAWLRDHHLPDTRAALVVGAPFARTLVPGIWLTEALAAAEIVVLVDGDPLHTLQLDTSP